MHPSVHSHTNYIAITTVAKTWKQLTRPSTDEWKMYIYAMEYYSPVKKEDAICSNMDETGGYHSK